MTNAVLNSRRLLEAPVGATLLRLAAPMVAGIASVILFNVVDTFWVGQLGARELAAMAFTFPVAFVVASLAMGLGIGTTAAISRAIGQGDQALVRRLTTDGLALANSLVVLMAGAGLLTIDPLFHAMGATDELLPLIRAYLVPWYLGIGLLVIPMVGNGAIRATGDTKTPSVIMVSAGIVNVVLDPLLIFGIGPLPRLGLQGAAFATIASYLVGFIVGFWVLARREKMLDFSLPRPADVIDSWRRITFVGLPAAGTNMLVPLAAGILTRLVAEFGEEPVAAFGVCTRLESLAMIGIGALSTAITPFVGQNHGAGRLSRIREAFRFSVKAAVIHGLALALVYALLARPIAGIFNDDPLVVDTIVVFLFIVPVTFAPYGVAQLTFAMFNALGRPYKSAAVVTLRLFAFAIPLGWLLSRQLGVLGVFIGLAAANILAGTAAILLVNRELAHTGAQLSDSTPTSDAKPTAA